LARCRWRLKAAPARLRFPLGISIIGGLLLSQMLTLYTTPVIYLALDRITAARKGVAPVGPELRRSRGPRGDAVMASISEPFIRRPVGTRCWRSAFSVGVVAYEFLRSRRFPCRFSLDPGQRDASGRRSLGNGGNRRSPLERRLVKSPVQPDHLDKLARRDQHPAAIRHRSRYRPCRRDVQARSTPRSPTADRSADIAHFRKAYRRGASIVLALTRNDPVGRFMTCGTP